VPHLIDGNNLLYALAAEGVNVGRDGLCTMLEALVERGERVSVVFDGPPPDDAPGRQIAGKVEVAYAGPRSADALLAERIARDTAPRRLAARTSRAG